MSVSGGRGSRSTTLAPAAPRYRAHATPATPAPTTTTSAVRRMLPSARSAARPVMSGARCHVDAGLGAPQAVHVPASGALTPADSAMATPQAQFAAAFAASQDARGSAQQIMEANAWLERFQSTTDAWQVADQLLQHGAQAGEGAGALVFAAQTMRSKIQYDWAELPAESHVSLRSSLLAHVVRYGVGPQPVLTQLCLAIATLALHMESWGGVVGDLIGAMTTPPESAAAKLPCLLGLLTVLPEEAENFKVRAPLPPLL